MADRALRQGVESLPVGERSLSVSYNGFLDEPGQLDGIDADVRRELAGATSGEVKAQLIFREIEDTQGNSFFLGGADDLADRVQVVSGRLPESCTPTRCEVVIVGEGEPPAGLADLGLVVVGRVERTDPLLFSGGFAPADGSPLLVADGVAAAGAIGSLTQLPARRTAGWRRSTSSGSAAWASTATSPSRPPSSTGSSAPTTGWSSWPPTPCCAARPTARSARRAGSRCSAGRPPRCCSGSPSSGRWGCGATRASSSSCCAAGAPAPVRSVGSPRSRPRSSSWRARFSGSWAAPSSRRGWAAARDSTRRGRRGRAVTGSAVGVVVLGLAALGLVVATLLWPAEAGRRAWRLVDTVLVVSVLLIAVALSRGGVAVGSLDQGIDPLLVLLPLLAALVTGLRGGAAWPVLARLVQHVLPRRWLAPRLALLGGVRQPLRVAGTTGVPRGHGLLGGLRGRLPVDPGRGGCRPRRLRDRAGCAGRRGDVPGVAAPGRPRSRTTPR